MNVIPLDFFFDHTKILDQLSSWIGRPWFTDMVKLELTVNPLQESPWCTSRAEFDTERKVFIKNTKAHAGLRPQFDYGEIARTYATIESYLASRGESIHRARVIKLGPTSAYPYHRDEDEYRIHIPLKTNKYAGFITDGEMEFMHQLGRAYEYRTTYIHSAFNAGDEVRIHLIFDVDKTET